MSAHEDEFPGERSTRSRYQALPHKCGACVIDRARGYSDAEIFCRIEVRDLDGGDATTALARAQDIAQAFNRADSEQRWDRMVERASTPESKSEEPPRPRRRWHIYRPDPYQNLTIAGTHIVRDGDWISIFDKGDEIAWLYQPQVVREVIE